MTITVVIPSLGRTSLERSVKSAVTQSHAPVEIIVVNNGPEGLKPDRELALLAMADSIPLRIVSLPPFSGPSICRNVGAWEAVAPYVAFLDDDDELTPDYLAAMWSRIIEHGAPILYGAKIWLNADGSVRKEKRLRTVPSEEWFATLYRHENPGFGGQNLLVRRDEFFRLGGFPVDVPTGEDRAFAMAALAAGTEIAYVDGAVVQCHDPSGYRARMRSDKWVTNLKLMRQYWPNVGWRVRLRSLWRWSRSFLRRRN